jgi:S-adenosylmethionine:tRNA ribosyltransferase-isomerase
MNGLGKGLNISEYDYDLPVGRIAQYPVKERDQSKLLLYNKGTISADAFRNIDKYLHEDSLLVFNNTKVIRARLLFTKESGAKIEIFCLEPILPVDYQQSFGSGSPVEWKCIIGNLKKWKNGVLTTKASYKSRMYFLKAEKMYSDGETWIVRFTWSTPGISFGEVIESAGHIPLPPYLNRSDEEDDKKRYQTIYSKIKGSVAAPTAGLHFTDALLRKIALKGIKSEEITLHVGAGTFQPIKGNNIYEHEMHCEHFYFSLETLYKILVNRDRIIAVGTTSVRTLESIYWIGVMVLQNKNIEPEDLMVEQWEPYRRKCVITVNESLEALVNYMKIKGIEKLHSSTKLIIIPGYTFRMIKGMITNFHQPKSTLLMLVSAWVVNDWKKIYEYALENDFRFLSYGDSSLLL